MRPKTKKAIKKPLKLLIALIFLAIIAFAFYHLGSLQNCDKVPANRMKVKLYYYNSHIDKNYDFGPDSVVPIEADISASKTIIQDTIKLLIKRKPTLGEKARGFSSEVYHPDLKLLDANLTNGVLTLTFNEVPGFTSGGMAHISVMLMQIKRTALQFPQVKKVVFKPDDIFQP